MRGHDWRSLVKWSGDRYLFRSDILLFTKSGLWRKQFIISSVTGSSDNLDQISCYGWIYQCWLTKYLEKSDCEMSIDKSDLCLISKEQPCQTALMLYVNIKVNPHSDFQTLDFPFLWKLRETSQSHSTSGTCHLVQWCMKQNSNHNEESKATF